jgi:hypothetical protein
MLALPPHGRRWSGPDGPGHRRIPHPGSWEESVLTWSIGWVLDALCHAFGAPSERCDVGPKAPSSRRKDAADDALRPDDI